MNLPFEVVFNSPINKSKTKEAHAFQKQDRFKPYPEQTPNNLHYDIFNKTISSNLKRRSKSFSQAQRFVYKEEESPGPSGYNIKRTFQNLQKKQGPHITSQRKEQQRPVSPGPAAYNPKIVKNNTAIFSFGFEQKTKENIKDYTVGPAFYKTQKYGTFDDKQFASRYKKVQVCKIPRSQRFFNKDERKDFPSPQNCNLYMMKDTIQIKKQTSYSFGNKKRVTSPDIALTPGPGAYLSFSQFSQRKNQLEAKLNRLSYLIKQDKNTR